LAWAQVWAPALASVLALVSVQPVSVQPVSVQPVSVQLVEALVWVQRAWVRFLWASERSPFPLDAAYSRAAIPWPQNVRPEIL
jgi:hypothetical protein